MNMFKRSSPVVLHRAYPVCPSTFWTSIMRSVVWKRVCEISVLNRHYVENNNPPGVCIFWNFVNFIWSLRRFFDQKLGIGSSLWPLAGRSPFPITAGVPDLHYLELISERNEISQDWKIAFMSSSYTGQGRKQICYRKWLVTAVLSRMSDLS